MVNCKLSSPNAKVNPDDVVSVQIIDDPAPARDSVDVDNSLTPFEKMSQKLFDALRDAYNLDPTGELRGVAVCVTQDNGKIWQIVADSTEDSRYSPQEVWTKSYVEAEVAKTKTAYAKSTGKASPV